MSLTPNLDITRKFFGGQERGRIFAFCPVSTANDVWPTGGSIPWQTVAEGVAVSSTNAADHDATGAGVKSVTIAGLGSAGELQSEVLYMSGTTQSISTLQYLRVNSMETSDVGTYGARASGNITLRVSGTAPQDVMSAMLDSSGVAGNGFYSVPLGKTMYITSLKLMGTQGSDFQLIMYQRADLTTVAGGRYGAKKEVWSTATTRSHPEFVFDTPIQIKALNDMWLHVIGPVSGSRIVVALDYFLMSADHSGN